MQYGRTLSCYYSFQTEIHEYKHIIKINVIIKMISNINKINVIFIFNLFLYFIEIIKTNITNNAITIAINFYFFYLYSIQIFLFPINLYHLNSLLNETDRLSQNIILYLGNF